MCIKSLDRQQLDVNDGRYLGTNVMNLWMRWNVYYLCNTVSTLPTLIKCKCKEFEQNKAVYDLLQLHL